MFRPATRLPRNLLKCALPIGSVQHPEFTTHPNPSLATFGGCQTWQRLVPKPWESKHHRSGFSLGANQRSGRQDIAAAKAKVQDLHQGHEVLRSPARFAGILENPFDCGQNLVMERSWLGSWYKSWHELTLIDFMPHQHHTHSTMHY